MTHEYVYSFKEISELNVILVKCADINITMFDTDTE